MHFDLSELDSGIEQAQVRELIAEIEQNPELSKLIACVEGGLPIEFGKAVPIIVMLENRVISKKVWDQVVLALEAKGLSVESSNDTQDSQLDITAPQLELVPLTLEKQEVAADLADSFKAQLVHLFEIGHSSNISLISKTWSPKKNQMQFPGEMKENSYEIDKQLLDTVLEQVGIPCRVWFAFNMVIINFDESAAVDAVLEDDLVLSSVVEKLKSDSQKVLASLKLDPKMRVSEEGVFFSTEVVNRVVTEITGYENDNSFVKGTILKKFFKDIGEEFSHVSYGVGSSLYCLKSYEHILSSQESELQGEVLSKFSEFIGNFRGTQEKWSVRTEDHPRRMILNRVFATSNNTQLNESLLLFSLQRGVRQHFAENPKIAEKVFVSIDAVEGLGDSGEKQFDVTIFLPR